MARNGGHFIADILGTETLQHPKSRSEECCFSNVRLPLAFASSTEQKVLAPSEGPRVVKWIMDRALCEHNTWIPGKFYGGAAWMRFSAQIYLEMKDFEWAAGVLKGLCERVNRGEWRSPPVMVV